MATSFNSRLSTAPEEGCKAPCVTVSLTNITLSGEQTIGVTAVVTGDRVLVAGQTDSAENGIWVCNSSSWTRAKDWNTAEDVAPGMLIPVSATEELYQTKPFTGAYNPSVTEITFGVGILSARSVETQTGSQAVSGLFTLTTTTYTPGANNLEVDHNGQRLNITTDYTEPSASTIQIVPARVINPDDIFTFRTNSTVSNSVTTTTAISHTRGGVAHNLATYLDGFVMEFDTMADAIASTKVYEGAVLLIKDRANSHWDVVLSSGVTENGYNIVQGVGVGTLSFVLRQTPNTIYPRQWGAVLDGVTDDSLTLNAIADYINAAEGGYTVDFGDNTSVLISYQGSAYASVYGYVVMDFLDAPNTHLKGRNVTVTCVNHNITTYGGLRFAHFQGCPNHSVEGFYFDMTFTGANTSGSFYPFCGAITAIDTATGTYAQSEINSNCRYENLRFKLYHEKGSYMQSANAYAGDPNNGFKIYSVFNSGDYLATTYATQHRNVSYKNITFEKGHNGYGLWAWAYNNVTCDEIRGLDYVSKYSTSGGSVGGTGVPMIRYHQWNCSGVSIDNIYFRAKPCSERTTVGFEGAAKMIDLNAGLTAGAYTHGLTTIGDNIVCILGRGDGANTLMDYGVQALNYGIITIGAMVCDSTTETTNAAGGNETHVRFAPESDGGQGFMQVNIGKLSFGPNCDRSTNISIDNGSSTAANRRLKQLTIDQIQSYGQLQYCISIGDTSTTYGVQDVQIGKVIVNGTDNSVYTSASTNSRALKLSCSEATDTITIDSLVVRDKYYVATTDQVNCSIGNFVINDLKVSGITAYWTTDVPVVHMTGLNTPEAAIPANIGSTFHRCNGGASTCLYVKESGTSNTGWVAK